MVANTVSVVTVNQYSDADVDTCLACTRYYIQRYRDSSTLHAVQVIADMYDRELDDIETRRARGYMTSGDWFMLGMLQGECIARTAP